MTPILMVIQIVLAIIITIAVLLQKSSSIGLGAYTSSNESMFGAKGPAGFLAKFTSIAALLFVINTLALGYYYSKQNSASIMSNKDNIVKSVGVSDNNKTSAANATEGNSSTASSTASSTGAISESNNSTGSLAKENTDANMNKTVSSNDTTDANLTVKNTRTEDNKSLGTTSKETNTSTSNANVTSEANISTVSFSAPSDADTLAASKLTKEAEQEAIINEIGNKQVSPKAHILKGVSFKSGSSVLLETSAEQINAIVEALKKEPSVKVLLRGHTDNTGKNSANMTISAKRADALKASLVSKGINANRIQTEGKGDASPIASNGSKEGRDLNRRVDIAVIN